MFITQVQCLPPQWPAFWTEGPPVLRLGGLLLAPVSLVLDGWNLHVALRPDMDAEASCIYLNGQRLPAGKQTLDFSAGGVFVLHFELYDNQGAAVSMADQRYELDPKPAETARSSTSAASQSSQTPSKAPAASTQSSPSSSTSAAQKPIDNQMAASSGSAGGYLMETPSHSSDGAAAAGGSSQSDQTPSTYSGTSGSASTKQPAASPQTSSAAAPSTSSNSSSSPAAASKASSASASSTSSSASSSAASRAPAASSSSASSGTAVKSDTQPTTGQTGSIPAETNQREIIYVQQPAASYSWNTHSAASSGTASTEAEPSASSSKNDETNRPAEEASTKKEDADPGNPTEKKTQEPEKTEAENDGKKGSGTEEQEEPQDDTAVVVLGQEAVRSIRPATGKVICEAAGQQLETRMQRTQTGQVEFQTRFQQTRPAWIQELSEGRTGLYVSSQAQVKQFLLDGKEWEPTWQKDALGMEHAQIPWSITSREVEIVMENGTSWKQQTASFRPMLIQPLFGGIGALGMALWMRWNQKRRTRLP